MNKGIKISPNYFQSDWNNLDLSKDNKDDWELAIKIFKDRIEGRYFKQIEILDKNPDRSIGLFSGFAIMSIGCLLIETIEQFWNGNVQTSRNSKLTSKKKKWYHIFSKQEKSSNCNDAYAFYNFFQRSESFKAFFDTPEKANVFYNKIRCGLLHQGQTKGESLIHVKFGRPMLEWIDDKNIEKGLSIHRRKFIIEVENVYKLYLEKLEEKGSLNFRKRTLMPKMKYIVNQK